MRFRLLGIFTLLALLINVGAQAATLAGLHGDVLVNRGGGGYVPASGAMELVPGDSVMAQANGGGEITYPDGCKVQVAPVGVVAIAEHSPCAIETGSIPPQPSPLLGGFTGTQVLIGVAVVGGIAGAAVAFSGGGSKSKPASP